MAIKRAVLCLILLMRPESDTITRRRYNFGTFFKPERGTRDALSAQSLHQLQPKHPRCHDVL